MDVGKTAVDRAYEWLRDAITDGSLPPGFFIEEAMVCEAIGLSRTPVREAFQRLSGERYLNLVPRRGAQVRGLSATELYEVFNARLALESHALRELCTRRMGAPAPMREALKEMTDFPDLTSQEDFIAYGRLDIAFHRAFVQAAGNTLLLQMYDSLRPLHERSSLTQAHAKDSMRAVTTSQHHALLEALSLHDADAAVRTLGEHLHPIAEIPAALGTGMLP